MNKIVHGECLPELKMLADQSVDLVATDPPFNIGIQYGRYKDSDPHYLSNMKLVFEQCARVLKSYGSIYVFINDEYVADYVSILKSLGLKMRNWIIWSYDFGNHLESKFGRNKTHILYFSKSNDFIFDTTNIRTISERQLIGDKRADPRGRVPGDVWNFPRIAGTHAERLDYKCQLPQKLVERIILASSSVGHIVLDPFCGTGTVPYVSQMLGRRYIGIDIDAEAIKITRSRLAGVT